MKIRREELAFSMRIVLDRMLSWAGLLCASSCLEAATTLAALYSNRQSASVDDVLRRENNGLLLLRGFDSTPWLVQFGGFQADLEKSARYLVRHIVHRPDGTVHEQWKTVPFDEFKKAYPRANTRSGVVELCGFFTQLVISHASISPKMIVGAHNACM